MGNAVYDRMIMLMLLESGKEGISVAQLSRKLYNENCSFFDDLDYEFFHQYVVSFLQRKSRMNQPTVVPAGTRGHYRISTDCYQQLSLQFSDTEEEESSSETEEDSRQLSLF